MKFVGAFLTFGPLKPYCAWHWTTPTLGETYHRLNLQHQTCNVISREEFLPLDHRLVWF